VAVTGANGQLGRALIEAVEEAGHDAIALTRDQLNLEGEDVEKIVAHLEVDWIAHCAAYTGVNRAEEEPERARLINVSASAAIARGAARSGSRLLYVSTDYVFDGAADRPYGVDASTGAINVYGATKREGEEAVSQLHEGALIVRTSWLMGGDTPNFASTMMRLGRTREELHVISDQTGRPTWVFHLAPALVELMGQDAQGVLHVANAGQATWHEVAERLLSEAQAQGEDLGSLDLRPTSTERYGAPARRPAYSVLDLSRARDVYGVTLPDWRLGVSRAVASCR
jgi:dTDP-4-dehydrorhamnose reductase